MVEMREKGKPFSCFTEVMIPTLRRGWKFLDELMPAEAGLWSALDVSSHARTGPVWGVRDPAPPRPSSVIQGCSREVALREKHPPGHSGPAVSPLLSDPDCVPIIRLTNAQLQKYLVALVKL